MGSMFPIHGTSSTLYVSILETLQICTLYFMMNKVLVSITCLHFSPLCFNLHIRSPSTTILHTDLQIPRRLAEILQAQRKRSFIHRRWPRSPQKTKNRRVAQALLPLGRALRHQRGHPTRVLSPMWLRRNRCSQLVAHRAPYTFLSLKRSRYVLSTLWWIKFWSP